MTRFQEKNEEQRTQWVLPFFIILLFLSFYALGLVLWNLTTLVKIWFLGLGKNPLALYPWTYIFFHPIDGNLFNYLVVCLFFGLICLSMYLFKDRIPLNRVAILLRDIKLWVLGLLILLDLGLLCWVSKPASLEIRIAKMMGVACLPLLIPFLNPAFWAKRNVSGRIWMVCTLILFSLVSLEPISIVRGPARLMNEYVEIFNETFVKGKKISNRDFLDKLSEVDIETVKAFYDLKNKLENISSNALDEEGIEFLRLFKFIDLTPSQRYIEKLSEVTNLAEIRRTKKGEIDTSEFIDNLARIDVESIKIFYLANLLENLHQTMGRGQINHIGHIINPINEYELGKPLQDIYFQYGIGYTFLMKWVMEAFGGISIDNYYRAYYFYVIYFAGFLLLLFILFSDRVYVFAAFLVIPVCFYSIGYIAVILAPGVIPSLHLLDVPVFILLFLFFRDGRYFLAGTAGGLSILSILLNRNFGIALFVSCLVAGVIYSLDLRDGRKRYWGLFISFCFLALAVVAFFLSDVGSGKNVFPYYLHGFYSWPIPPVVIAATILYLIFSYSIILYVRHLTFHWKYFYILVFIYAQIALVYFFWSGLANHLPPVFTFVGLQIFVILYILEKYSIADWKRARWLPSVSFRGMILVLIIFLIIGGVRYINEKTWFHKNFTDHPVYPWTFERAKVVSTIDPIVIQENLSLIQKYSDSKKPGIYMISRYDGLFPFLARRYSAMPFFEMISFVFSGRERDEAINRIQLNKPQYLFVDTNLEERFKDRWAILNNSDFFQKERAAHLGRHDILREIFLQVREGYEKIEEASLISVYKRK